MGVAWRSACGDERAWVDTMPGWRDNTNRAVGFRKEPNQIPLSPRD